MEKTSLELLYEEFIKLDYEEELNQFPKLRSKKTFISFWKKWYEIDYKQFELIIWKTMNRATSIDDLIEITGTLNLSLRLLKLLKQFNFIEVIENKIILSEKFLTDNLPKENFVDHSKFVNQQRYGQFRATWESSIRRAEIINKELPLSGRVFFCGDDDLTSLALKQYKNRDVSVGDIDKELIEKIFNLNNSINCYYLDVREEINEELKNQYDAVHCDPLDDGVGLNLWLNRAEELLRGKKGDLIFINVSVKRLGNRIVYLQNFLTSLGYCLKDIIHNLSSYRVSEEPFIEEDLIKKNMNEIGFSNDIYESLYIKTDMLIFMRLIDKPNLFPQEYYEIRRKI